LRFDREQSESLNGLYFIFRSPRIETGQNEFDGLQRAGRRREEQQMTARVTVEEVERVAELAHLELAPEESAHMLHDLNAILDYVAELNELNTVGVAPLAQVTELFSASGSGGLRADENLPSLDRVTVLAQAPETDQVFFKVPKVIER
jgi:aspartyl-tRNA(Asn)/glutamyl-tRNA(Gln) amidotransferase subunit C